MRTFLPFVHFFLSSGKKNVPIFIIVLHILIKFVQNYQLNLNDTNKEPIKSIP